MSHPTASFSSPSDLEFQVVQIGRDYNVNRGTGTFTVNNDNRVVEQTRPITWHIQGTEEEEEEYDQYSEYRRSDVRLFQRIHHERLKEWDSETAQYVLSECERSIWLGEILSGDGKGNIVTVVSYEGQDAPKKWKNSFQRHSEHLRAGGVHLMGLNRSEMPQLILSGDHLPASIFTEKIGVLGRLYLHSMRRHFGSTEEEMWMDHERGVIWGGPEGSNPDLGGWGLEAENPVATVDVLNEDDVLARYLEDFKMKEIDRTSVEKISSVWHDRGEPELVDRPTVFHTLTNIPIAVANNMWKSSNTNFVERKLLEDGRTRFDHDSRQSIGYFP
ncbi:hypothetical protein PQX77_014181 [Marasmius sp. AFHP31]|nr:hypothetical protein PQX77_014181 [Marasmius sp. AFHP31]